MITKFKIFENNIEFVNSSYWVIYGNKQNAIDILKKIISKNNYSPSIIGRLKSMIISMEEYIFKNIYKHSIGQFIVFQKNSYFEQLLFSTFDDESEKIDFMNRHKNFEFKGEIKLENDNLILDPLEADVNKYNL